MNDRNAFFSDRSRLLKLSIATFILVCLSSFGQAAPLHDAAKEGDLALITKLLDEGADVNQPSAIATPLFFAVREKQLDAVKLLLQRGADVEGKSLGMTALQGAARSGSIDFVRVLLDHGADPKATFKMGLNSLHIAATGGHLDVVRLLLEHGANVNSEDDFGQPAIHFATLRNHADVAQLLLEHGSKAPDVEPIGELVRVANPDHGKELTKQCMHCHVLEKGGKTKVGPPLWGVLGRDKASVADFNYSDALKSAGGKWTYEDLNRFVAHPGWEIPGTAMTLERPLHSPSDRADLIGFLRTLSDQPLPLP
jgi:cytochrome c